MDNAVWLALLLPALGALLCGLTSSHLGRAGTALTACTAIGLAFIASLSAATVATEGGQRASASWTFLDTQGLSVELGAFCDPLTVTMLLVITGVGFLIHVYSVGYMGEEPRFGRYFTFLNLFVAAMVTLVIADGLPMLLIGWGAVGFASFALIGFYEARPSAVKASRKAFVINLVGDVGLLLAVFLAAGAAGGQVSLSPESLARLASSEAAPWLGLCLLVAAYAKSAQLPLHTWLPDAMEGPTPVSALIHAATMVTAGVYLLVRTHPIFEAVPALMAAVALLGALSSLYAASVALVQTELKRVLAYSTMSQLGYMFMACGVGAYGAAMFHLVTHAFFKALLFLSAGVVIHALHDEQSMLRMGGLRGSLPGAYRAFLVGTLALTGLPLLSGFFSKDLILESIFLAADRGVPGADLVWVAGLLTASLTSFYMFRALYLTFFGAARHGVAHPHPPGPTMVWPVTALGLLALAGGALNLPSTLPLGPLPPQVLEGFLEPSLKPLAGLMGHGHPPLWASLVAPLLASVIGFGLASLLVLNRPVSSAPPRGLARWLFHGWGLDAAIGALAGAVHRVAGFSAARLDRLLAGSLPEGLGESVEETGATLGLLQTGSVRGYALAILAGLALLLGTTLILFKAGPAL